MSADMGRTWRAADGAPVFYRLARGEGPRPVLVLLHGMASNSTRWNEFARETRLRECCDLMRIDRRGQGGSVWRGAGGMREWCGDIAGILAAEGYPRAFVGGHCLGANIALEFAARHRSLVDGLVLVEPMPPEALAGTLARVARWRGAMAALLALARAANAIGLRRRRVRPPDLEALDRDTRARLAAGDCAESALAIHASPLEDLRATPAASYLRDLLAVTAPLPPLATIDVPALVLVSRDSDMTDPRLARRAMSALPAATFVDIPARHWIPTEAPEAMRSAIEAWLGPRACRPNRSSRPWHLLQRE